MKLNYIKNFLLLCTAVFSNSTIYSQTGVLDTTFGTNGIVLTDINQSSSTVFSTALQSDGKIVAAGINFVTGSGQDYCVVRYNANGSLDASFGTNGIATVALGILDDFGRSIAIQSDGKILVAGNTRVQIATTQTRLRLGVIRLNSNGTLDTSFDSDGIATFALSTLNDNPGTIALQSDGKIIIGGTASTGSNFFTVRLNTNGTLDTSFSSDGIVLTTIDGQTNLGRACAVQPDGKILVCGVASSGDNASFAIIRLNSNGTLDTTFSGDGKASTPMRAADDENMGMVLQPDGKILLGGIIDPVGLPALYEFGVVRFNANGSLDTTFGTAGKLTTSIGATSDYGNCIALQPDGKFVVGGYAFNGVNNDFALAKYNSNGSLDTTFGTNGTVITAVTGLDDKAYSVIFQPDGKIILAGKGGSIFGLVRYNNNTLSSENFIKQENSIKIYPNPTEDLLTIDIKQNTTISIIDVSGKVVLTKEISTENNTINIQSIAIGIYLITADSKIIAKIIKK